MVFMAGVLLVLLTIVQALNEIVEADETLLSCQALATAGMILLIYSGFIDNAKKIFGFKGTTIMRRRRKISSIFYELGPVIATRAYRMKPSSFWKLHKKLLLHLYTSINNKKRKRGKTPNGDISTVTRLSIALRYFSGGCPFDISLVHWVSHVEVFHSIWKVVDAVNQCNIDE